MNKKYLMDKKFICRIKYLMDKKERKNEYYKIR